MDDHIPWAVGLKATGALLLVLANALCVAAELALVRLRETQLASAKYRAHRHTGTVRKLRGNLNAAISATQLGITLAGLGLGWLLDPLVEAALHPIAKSLGLQGWSWLPHIVTVLGFGFMSFVLIIIGEMVPKAMAIQRPADVALTVGPILAWFQQVTRPFIWLIDRTSERLARALGVTLDLSEGSQTEEELRILFLGSSSAASSTSLGREIVLNALELRHRVARDVMRPRRELVCLSTSQTVTSCLELAERTRFSRFPLCEDEDLDRMLGVVHIKDLYVHRAAPDATGASLTPHARRLIYVPETARLEKVLQLLLEQRLHMAVVVDEFGGTVGLITLENIVEELVGQIQDEFDQEKPLAAMVEPDVWEIAGDLPLHELSHLVGEPLLAGEITTASGYVTSKAGSFPHVGQTLAVGAFELEVLDTDSLRVSRLLLRKKPAPGKSDTQPSPPSQQPATPGPAETSGS